MMRKKKRKKKPKKARPPKSRRTSGRRRIELRCPGCGAKARFLKKEEIIKVGPVRYLYRWAKCPRCTKAFLVKEPS